MGPGVGTVAAATLAAATGRAAAGLVLMRCRASRRMVCAAAASKTAVGGAGNGGSGAATGIGAAATMLVAALGIGCFGCVEPAVAAAAGRGAGVTTVRAATVADLAVTAVAGRSAPTSALIEDRRGADGALADFPDCAAPAGSDEDREGEADEDPDSAGAARAGAHVARPRTAPIPNVAAKPPTRPANPAAVMARIIAGCGREASVAGFCFGGVRR